jgi:hypothetical protein
LFQCSTPAAVHVEHQRHFCGPRIVGRCMYDHGPAVTPDSWREDG